MTARALPVPITTTVRMINKGVLIVHLASAGPPTNQINRRSHEPKMNGSVLCSPKARRPCACEPGRPSDQTHLPCYCLRRGAALGHGPAYAKCRYVVVHFARNNRSAFRSDRERYCRRQYADLLAIRGLAAAMGDHSTGPMMRTGATRRLTPRDAVGVGLLRDMSAPRAARLRRAGHPLGRPMSSDKLRQCAHCTACRHEGATIQHSGWAVSDTAVLRRLVERQG
jgi:hypothetical protein